MKTAYDSAMDMVVITHMSKGAGLAEVAAELGISRDTLYEWCKKEGDYYKPTLSDAIKRGKELSEAWWTSEGRKSLRDKNFNSTLWYMNMKNRFGWKDKTEVVATIDATVAHVVDSVLASEFTEFLKRKTG
jgi:hypothetical protein